MRVRTALVIALSLGTGTLLEAQEPRLAGRMPDPLRFRVDSILTEARGRGLPTEPLIDRALEGAAKGAGPDLIVSAVIRLRDELVAVRSVFGDTASAAELAAGASALRAGAQPDDLARLRQVRSGKPLTVPAAVLADLMSAGVPADTAVTAVLALARGAADAEYIAFRRNVQRDIELGASPSSALAVRLRAAGEMLDSPSSPGTGTSAPPPRRRQKP